MTYLEIGQEVLKNSFEVFNKSFSKQNETFRINIPLQFQLQFLTITCLCDPGWNSLQLIKLNLCSKIFWHPHRLYPLIFFGFSLCSNRSTSYMFKMYKNTSKSVPRTKLGIGQIYSYSGCNIDVYLLSSPLKN